VLGLRDELSFVTRVTMEHVVRVRDTDPSLSSPLTSGIMDLKRPELLSTFDPTCIVLYCVLVQVT
jgi:hypothetical protein